MKLNGTTRAILNRPLTRQQAQTLASIPAPLRAGALWRTLKFNDPWPRRRRPEPINQIELNSDPDHYEL